jgi:hypothetical protein
MPPLASGPGSTDERWVDKSVMASVMAFHTFASDFRQVILSGRATLTPDDE